MLGVYNMPGTVLGSSSQENGIILTLQMRKWKQKGVKRFPKATALQSDGVKIPVRKTQSLLGLFLYSSSSRGKKENIKFKKNKDSGSVGLAGPTNLHLLHRSEPTFREALLSTISLTLIFFLFLNSFSAVLGSHQN